MSSQLSSDENDLSDATMIGKSQGLAVQKPRDDLIKLLM